MFTEVTQLGDNEKAAVRGHVLLLGSAVGDVQSGRPPKARPWLGRRDPLVPKPSRKERRGTLALSATPGRSTCFDTMIVFA